MGPRSDRLAAQRKREHAAAILLYGLALGSAIALALLVFAPRLGPSYEDYESEASALVPVGDAFCPVLVE